jgi:diguanylate cyclase (GGDEF)-like protein
VTEDLDPRPQDEPIDPKDWPILLVDDDEKELEAFRRSYGAEFSVMCTTSAEAALEALRDGDFALVIADQRLPGMSGVEFLTRTLSDWPDLQRFLVTGFTDPKVVMDGLNRARIDQYVTKPWDEDALRIALLRAIEVRATLLRTRAQMAKLRAQNAALGQKVRERTREIGAIADRQRRLTVIDGVTGLHNHRLFRERWRDEVRRSRRYGATVSLIQIEIDGIRGAEGIDPIAFDRLLKDLALLLRISVRDVDLVARFGTLEYSIVLPETPKPNGALLAGRLAKAVRERRFSHPGGGRVTVSVGLGAFPDDGDTSSEVLARTRSAMKRSRAVGGDHVYIVSDEDEGLLEGSGDYPFSEDALAALQDPSMEFTAPPDDSAD